VAALGKPLSVSHRILPEFREYERTSTVVVNAYLQPLMQSYMERRSARERGEKEQQEKMAHARRGGKMRRASSSCNRAAESRRWNRRRGNRCAPCYRVRRADWWARRRWRAQRVPKDSLL
jgi:hypothetical protein